jgi:3-oxoadipate enol-lactonase
MLPHDEAGGGTAVVLLHAGIADRTMWREHLDPLAAAGYRTVAVDLPGFGEARPAEGEQAPWMDVLETLEALAIDRAVIVGNSFGGAVALRVAAVAPGRVAALALISAPAPGIEPSPELEAIWEAEEAALARGGIEAAVEVVVNAWVLPDAPATLRERVADMQRRALELQADAPPATEAVDPLEQDPGVLGTLEIPTLVVVGDRDLGDFEDGAEMLARTLPRARHVVIEGAGHLAPMETPDEFRRVLLGFLAHEHQGR